MSQDTVADALNKIMNAQRAGKTEVVINRFSKTLTSVLAIAKLRGYVADYKIDGKKLTIKLGGINGCQAIKPRYTVQVPEIEKYVKRYLPAKHLGIIIISTSQGLMTHTTAIEKNIGGSLIAYFY